MRKYEIEKQELIDTKSIYIFDEITNELAERVVWEILTISKNYEEEGTLSKDRVITMYISSPGGSISAGLAIIDCMHSVNAKFKTIGLGMVASMASIILACGTRGQRKASRYCEVLIHQPLGNFSGQASDLAIQLEHMQRIKGLTAKILSERTGKSVEQITADTDRDYVMTAVQAKEYGIIDSVLKTNEFCK